MRIMAAVAPFDVSALIDSRPLGALQIRIIVLCTLVALLDGLDLQSIGLAAPGIAADLNIPPPWLSAVFSAALAGLALGAFGFGVLADRIGRKAVLIGATACFGIFTICTALAPSFAVLLAFRFLAGLGLGGAMPSFISLTSEYCPRRRRAMIVALLWAGFPLGGFVGGLLASWIIPAYGWHSVFWVGGVLPLIVCVVLVFALPESVGFLVASGAPPERISLLLRRAFPTEYIPTAPPFTLYEERAHGVPVVQLFAAGRAVGTLLLWISFFIAFMMLVTNSAWAPTLLKREGIGIKEASFAMAMFNLGSVIATSFAGWLISRAGAAIILPVAMIGSAVSVALVGYAAPSVRTVILLQGLFGAFMGGGSSGLIALAAIYYPTAIRSTGVGWAMGMGRIGSFTGPLAVGLLVALGLSTAGIFVAIAVPALLAAATTAVVGRVKLA
jgi:MFS transporter, AAHS family, 4-hydroxybenzoate transporter